MPLITVFLRLALSAIFAAAGATKLGDQPGTRTAVTNFGAPESLTRIISILLPIVELVIAAGLLFANTAAVSALAALLMLTFFMLAIGVNLARGNTHDCHCFGQIYSRPLGWSTLLRNLIFALGAVVVLWQAKVADSLSIFSTLGEFTLTQWLWTLGGVLFLAAILIFSIRRHKTTPVESPARPQGLALHSPAPPFELTAYTGGTTSLAQLLSFGKPLLLVFTNPTCGPCVALFAEIKDWQQAHSERLTIALISFGTIKENFVNVARNQLGQVLLQHQREVAELYGANVTPTAVVVSTSGRIASPLAAGADEIRELLTNALGVNRG
jgi:uncharacterized membrane protein YphA (DoxX/SURF4 family)/peroxiredoxin